MAAFPGAFPWPAFAALPLDVYGEVYAMAVDILEQRARA